MSERRGRGRWWRYLLVGYAVWCVVLTVAQDSLVFPRAGLPAPNVGPPDARVRVWKLPVRGGVVEGWWVPHPRATRDNPRPAVIVFHGNGEIVDQLDRIVQDYHALGVSVLLPEYRGYGRSAGRPSEANIVSDAQQFAAKLAEQPEVQPSRICYHGRSLGGAVAAQLALVARPAALVLVSTPQSIARRAWGYGLPPLLVRHPFRTDRAVARLDCPVLVVHGTDDRLIPLREGRRLHELAKGSEWLELPGGHDGLPQEAQRAEYRLTLRKFLKRAEVLTD